MKRRYRYRSAVTGRYVSQAYARRYPKRTVRERVPGERASTARLREAINKAYERVFG